ncbi:hypothetical protein HDU97_000690 [Phlyctochytrium planicorne]|nr:hypothetical protein HDU97_000690 [Phlyctochytrium planicorne]
MGTADGVGGLNLDPKNATNAGVLLVGTYGGGVIRVPAKRSDFELVEPVNSTAGFLLHRPVNSTSYDIPFSITCADGSFRFTDAASIPQAFDDILPVSSGTPHGVDSFKRKGSVILVGMFTGSKIVLPMVQFESHRQEVVDSEEDDGAPKQAGKKEVSKESEPNKDSSKKEDGAKKAEIKKDAIKKDDSDAKKLEEAELDALNEEFFDKREVSKREEGHKITEEVKTITVTGLKDHENIFIARYTPSSKSDKISGGFEWAVAYPLAPLTVLREAEVQLKAKLVVAPPLKSSTDGTEGKNKAKDKKSGKWGTVIVGSSFHGNISFGDNVSFSSGPKSIETFLLELSLRNGSFVDAVSALADTSKSEADASASGASEIKVHMVSSLASDSAFPECSPDAYEGSVSDVHITASVVGYVLNEEEAKAEAGASGAPLEPVKVGKIVRFTKSASKPDDSEPNIKLGVPLAVDPEDAEKKHNSGDKAVNAKERRADNLDVFAGDVTIPLSPVAFVDGAKNQADKVAQGEAEFDDFDPQAQPPAPAFDIPPTGNNEHKDDKKVGAGGANAEKAAEKKEPAEKAENNKAADKKEGEGKVAEKPEGKLAEIVKEKDPDQDKEASKESDKKASPEKATDPKKEGQKPTSGKKPSFVSGFVRAEKIVTISLGRSPLNRFITIPNAKNPTDSSKSSPVILEPFPKADLDDLTILVVPFSSEAGVGGVVAPNAGAAAAGQKAKKSWLFGREDQKEGKPPIVVPSDQCGIFLSGYHFGGVSEFLELEFADGPKNGVAFVARLSFDLKKLWSIYLPHSTPTSPDRSSIDLSYGDVTYSTTSNAKSGKEKRRALYLSGTIPGNVNLQDYPALRDLTIAESGDKILNHFVAFLDPSQGKVTSWKWLKVHVDSALAVGLRMIIHPVHSRADAVAIAGTTELKGSTGANGKRTGFMPWVAIMEGEIEGDITVVRQGVAGSLDSGKGKADEGKKGDESKGKSNDGKKDAEVGTEKAKDEKEKPKGNEPENKPAKEEEKAPSKDTKKPDDSKPSNPNGEDGQKPDKTKGNGDDRKKPEESKGRPDETKSKPDETNGKVDDGKKADEQKGGDSKKEGDKEKEPAKEPESEDKSKKPEDSKAAKPNIDEEDGYVDEASDLEDTEGGKGEGNFFTFIFLIVVVAAGYIIYTQSVKSKSGGSGGSSNPFQIPMRLMHMNRSDMNLADDPSDPSHPGSKPSVLSSLLAIGGSFFGDSRGKYAPMAQSTELHHRNAHNLSSSSTVVFEGSHHDEEMAPAEWEREFERDWGGSGNGSNGTGTGGGMQLGKQKRGSATTSATGRRTSQLESVATIPASSSTNVSPSFQTFGNVTSPVQATQESKGDWGWDDGDFESEIRKEVEGFIEEPVAAPSKSGLASLTAAPAQIKASERKSDEWGWD